MLALPRETLSLVFGETDLSTRLSLWWTCKIFRPLIQIDKTMLKREKMTSFATRDGNVKIYNWLTKCKFPTNKVTVFNAGVSGVIEMMKKFSAWKQKHFITSLREGVIKNGSFSAYTNYNELVPNHVWNSKDILCFRDSEILDHHISSGAITEDNLYTKYVTEIKDTQNHIEYFFDKMHIPHPDAIQSFFQCNAVAEITLPFTLRMIDVYSILKEFIVRQTLRYRTWMMKDITNSVEIIRNGKIYSFLTYPYLQDRPKNMDKITTWIIENEIILIHEDFRRVYRCGSLDDLRKYLTYAAPNHRENTMGLGEITNLEKLELLHEFQIPFTSIHAFMKQHDCEIIDFLQEINQDVSHLASSCSKCCEKHFPSISLKQAFLTYDLDFVKKVYSEDSEIVKARYFDDKIPDEKIIPILEFLIEKGKYEMVPRNYSYNMDRPAILELFLRKNCPLTPKIRGRIAEKYPTLISLLVGK